VALLAAFDVTPPATYAAHRLHTDSDCLWLERNCYVDLWIELLHSLGANPIACCYPALAADFQGDQWTFVKPDHWALWALYGVQVIEVDVWTSVESHVIRQVRNHSLPLLETDCFYLPDLEGLSYRAEHKKSAIGIAAIDPEAEVLWYFHNRDFHAAEGEDYRGALYLDEKPRLVPYMEAARVDRLAIRPDDELRAASLDLLRQLLPRRGDPFEAFRRHLEEVLPGIGSGGVDFDEYAFANLRQLGMACALGAEYVCWAQLREAEAIATRLRRVSELAQLFIMRLARFAAGRRAPDAAESVAAMASAWREAQDQLRDSVAGLVCV
jgi:hypothetical protein